MTANIPSVHLQGSNLQNIRLAFLMRFSYLSHFFVRNMRMALKVKCAVGVAGVNEDGRGGLTHIHKCVEGLKRF